MMLRTALAVPAGIAVGLATGHPSQGVAITVGAMATALADRPGPLRTRLLRLSCGFLGGALGMTVGHLTPETGGLAILVFGLLAAVSGLVSVINGAASVFGLQLLVQAAIATGMQLDLPSWQLPLWAAVGGAWTLLLTAATALAGGLRTPEREAVAAVYDQVAELLGRIGPDPEDRAERNRARQQLVGVVNTAYDALVGARSRVHGRSSEYRALAGLLNAATPLLDAVVALAHTERPAPDGYRRCALLIAEAVRSGGRPPKLPAREPVLSGEKWPQEQRLTVRELRSALGAVLDQLAPGRSAEDEGAAGAGTALRIRARPESLGQRIAAVLDRVLTGPQTWLYVARLTLCVTAAETLSTQVEMERSYWMLLTVAIVMKPDFGSVFVRAVQRSLGTLAGVVLAGGLLALHPSKPLVVVLMAVLIGSVPYAMARNYGLFTLLLTPFTLLLVDSTGTAGGDVIGARLLDTVVGCAICLVLGFLLWPETWRPLVGRTVAESAEALARYLRAAFTEPVDARARTAARRNTYRRLSDVRTELQRVLAEPPSLSRKTSAWWPMLVQLERMADAITYTSTQLRGRGETADQDRVRGLAEATDDLVGAIREQRPPRGGMLPADTGQLQIVGKPVPPGPDPEEDVLELVARELRTARRMATGPPDR
jgi:uncharacterized membrane protein YccC